MRENKGFTPIIALVVILLVIGGIYLGLMRVKQNQTANPVYSPSPTVDTSNWKTYKNVELGFSISYPDDWDRVETVNNKLQRFGADEMSLSENLGLGFAPKGFNKNAFFWSLDIYSEPLVAAIKAYKLNAPGGACSYKEEREITFNSTVGKELVFTCFASDGSVQGSFENKIWLVEYRGSTFAFAPISGESTEKNTQIIKQILSTFKFN